MAFTISDDGKTIAISGSGADFDHVADLLVQASGNRATSHNGRINYRANRREHGQFTSLMRAYETQAARNPEPSWQHREMCLVESCVDPEPVKTLNDGTTVRFSGFGKSFRHSVANTPTERRGSR